MTVREILARCRSLSALVVGDICLDRWCTYDPAFSEPSRETGIPRLGVVATRTTAGAGGTVANNLAALEAGRVAVLGVVGEDGFALELKRALAALGIDHKLLIEAAAFQTFTYTKLLNRETGAEDQPRVDSINVQPLAAGIERELVSRLEAYAPEFDVVLVSDQAETAAGGVVTAAVRDALVRLAASDPRRVIWVDSRKRPELFRDVIVKANADEAREACLRLFGRMDLEALRKHVGARPMFVTQGARGVLIVDDGGERLVAARSVERPVDICGAGDSFSAGAALAYRVTGSAVEAGRLGNLVASVTIMKKGTGTASPAEVLSAAGEEA